MIRLIKENVERIAVDAERAKKWERKGYVRIDGQDYIEEVKHHNPVSETMTVAELRKAAKERGIGGAASLNKKELLELLKEVE